MTLSRKTDTLSRRTLLLGAAIGTASVFGGFSGARATVPQLRPIQTRPIQTRPIQTRPIPSSGAQIPAVGLGSWITFNVGRDPVLRAQSKQVIEAFLDAGGRMIDSSPMYGSAQSVIGEALETIPAVERVFSADKVWTRDDGAAQVAETTRLWGIERLDLLQVHNLMNWRSHLPLLQDMKAEGRLGYIGISTSHGRRHDELAEIMVTEPIDFVQLTYNAVDREAERRLLPLARDKGIAVIVNRPFRRGALTQRLEGRPLPGWAAEVGAETWAQILLKFILAHPAVTVAIPATTQPTHATENVVAAGGAPIDTAMQAEVIRTVRDL
jgi:diketogulonate reductase-like aldo/keto reductase